MLIRLCLVLGVLETACAWGQAPAYTAASVVNASDYAPGPFAPNSVLSVFGANLAWYTQGLMSSNISNSALPTQLGNIEVFVDNWPAPLLYVSPAQVNFLIPSNEISGNVPLRVVREGVTRPGR